MPKGKKPKTKRMTPAQQHARFVEAAEKAEADEAPDAMDKAIKKLDFTRKPSSPSET
jgi:hypothetical protein